MPLSIKLMILSAVTSFNALATCYVLSWEYSWDSAFSVLVLLVAYAFVWEAYATMKEEHREATDH